ncbi:hypothetical protein AVEN_91981-1 [Araneus ventricosus]|uniref:Uncharacterized protein n=1 Tax=Araneus ventricosus TaxID=182803 RepID=A0A4Y2RRB3_ARAVE|nr:hypothetical protein AVEN_91981-1 [Araneus ventricosus]
MFVAGLNRSYQGESLVNNRYAIDSGKLIKFSQWVSTQGEFSTFRWPEEDIEVIERSIKRSKPPKGYESYRGRYLSARYTNDRYLSSSFPKECYDAFLQLTKRISLAKRLAKIARGRNARKQVQNSSVEILTFNLSQSPDLPLRIRSSLLKPSRPAPMRRGQKVKSQ